MSFKSLSSIDLSFGRLGLKDCWDNDKIDTMGCPLKRLRSYPSNLIRIMPAQGWINYEFSASLI